MGRARGCLAVSCTTSREHPETRGSDPDLAQRSDPGGRARGLVKALVWRRRGCYQNLAKDPRRRLRASEARHSV